MATRWSVPSFLPSCFQRANVGLPVWQTSPSIDKYIEEGSEETGKVPEFDTDFSESHSWRDAQVHCIQGKTFHLQRHRH